MYENWTVGKKKIPESERYKWKSFFGLDYGYTNDPTGFVGFAANPVDRELYIYCEFCKKRMLNSDIAEAIRKLGFAKERIRADCAEPKSNDDLRRMGISRIIPSVKGRDSILNGIAAINEYRITVNPDCVNMIRELSSYVYDDRASENGLRLPKDSDNHLCDALRYAFEDVKHFRPHREEIKKAGAAPVLLTGDHESAASHIARLLDIQEYRSDCLPEDKLDFIDACQRKGEQVCMIGDGINDAPALKKAFVGIAMGGVGSDIAVDAADIALVNDDIRELPHLLRLARRMMTVIKCNLAFSMTLNFAAIILAITGILNPVVGALVHNAGSVAVIVHSAFLLRWKYSKGR